MLVQIFSLLFVFVLLVILLIVMLYNKDKFNLSPNSAPFGSGSSSGLLRSSSGDGSGLLKSSDFVDGDKVVKYNCRDNTNFNCIENEVGCFPDSYMYCNNGQTWCNWKEGNSNYQFCPCSFDSWDDCVSKVGCATDPAEVHPGWYDINKSKNNFERSKYYINKGSSDDAMKIVDECTFHNTDFFKNPRCKITQGKYQGKVGVCVMNNNNIEECQPIGQNCMDAIPNYCPKQVHNVMTGENGNVNASCFKKNNKVMLKCN